jgi:hypothetical protein
MLASSSSSITSTRRLGKLPSPLRPPFSRLVGITRKPLWGAPHFAPPLFRLVGSTRKPQWVAPHFAPPFSASLIVDNTRQRDWPAGSYLQAIPRWGGNDGPDDAAENGLNWTVLYALGAPEIILKLWKKGYEGHLRQYTEAKTVEVPMARDGMYYREFSVMFDWFHHTESLSAFTLSPLADPSDPSFGERTRRFSAMYMGDDPEAPNYDKQLKICRSIFSGSRGPLLRKATGLDWAGDPLTFADGTPCDVKELVVVRRPLRPATCVDLTGICLCDVCSCHEILRAQRTRAGTRRFPRAARRGQLRRDDRALRRVQRRRGRLAPQPLPHLPGTPRDAYRYLGHEVVPEASLPAAALLAG